MNTIHIGKYLATFGLCASLSACSNMMSLSTLSPWSNANPSAARSQHGYAELETISINQPSDPQARDVEQEVTLPAQDATDSRDAVNDNVVYPNYQTQFSYRQVDAYINRLMMTLQQNAPHNMAKKTIAVVNFVKFDQALTNVTLLGQHITEHLMQEGQRIGYQIIEHKVTNRIEQSSKGDTVFDYYLSHHAQHFDAVLTGTILSGPTGFRVNARVVDVSNQRILTSGDVFIPRFIVDQIPHFEAVPESELSDLSQADGREDNNLAIQP